MRIQVEERLSVTAGEHDFSEVLIQSANVARLIDVLEWARDTHAASFVRVCDPTQSNEGPVDLVAENHEKLFLFEVTDTIGTGFAAKIRKQALKLDIALNALRISSEGKTIEAFHVAGTNASMSQPWIPIGRADTLILHHRPGHVIDDRS